MRAAPHYQLPQLVQPWQRNMCVVLCRLSELTLIIMAVIVMEYARFKDVRDLITAGHGMGQCRILISLV